MKSWKKFLIVSLSFLFVVTSVLAGLVNFVKVDNTSHNSGNQNQESGVVTPPSPDNYDGMIYYASESEETGASVAPRDQKGGAIYVGSGSTFEMNNGKIENHEGFYGGAVYVANGGTFIMSGGSIEYNYSKYGGAIYIEKGGTCNILGGNIIFNKSENAPAIYVEDGGNLKFDESVANINGNDYTKFALFEISYYVDGVLYETSTQNTSVLNINNIPLDYTKCNGYFLDEEMTKAVDRGDNLYSDNVLKTAIGSTNDGSEAIKLYTKRATLSKLTMNLVDGSYYTAKAITSTISGDIVIPKMVNDYDVTTVAGAAFRNCKSIDNVYIPTSVTTIGAQAFDSSSVKNVNFTNKLTNIGWAAFQYAYDLKSVILQDSITTLSSELFRDCKGVTQIRLPKSITTIPGFMFDGCTNIESIELHENILEIGIAAFRGIEKITSLTIPENIVRLNSHTFSGCVGLVELNFNAKNVTSQSSNSFNGTGDLVVNFGAKVEKIPGYLFYDNSSLKTVNFEEGSVCNSIGDYAFYSCRNLESFDVPENVLELNKSQFQNCQKLKTFTINSNLTIASNTFDLTSIDNLIINVEDVTENLVSIFKTSITSLTLDEKVKSIGASAFKSFENLENITILSNVITNIGYNAFNSCSNLKGLYINDFDRWVEIDFADYAGNPLSNENCILYESGVEFDFSNIFITDAKKIGSYVLSSNNKLDSIVISNTVKSLGDCAFHGSPICNINIPSSVETVGSFPFFGNVKNFHIDSNVMLSFSTHSYRSLETLVIGNNVTVGIPMQKFYENESLKYVSMGDNVASIGENAFSLCKNLVSVKLSNSIKGSLTSAFAGCSSLQEVTIPSGVTGLYSNCFSNCTKLSKVTIENGLTTISNNTFMGCSNLEEITIPSSVNYIANNAFNGCNLKVLNIDNVNRFAEITFENETASPTNYGAIIYINGSKLTTISLNDATKVHEYAFHKYTEVTTLEIGATVQKVGYGSFYGCTNLSKVTFVDNGAFTRIEGSSFYGCYNLKSIVFPNTLEEIFSYAFNNCGLSSVSFPSSIKRFGRACFDDNVILTSMGSGALSYNWQMVDKDKNIIDNYVDFEFLINNQYYSEYHIGVTFLNDNYYYMRSDYEGYIK